MATKLNDKIIAALIALFICFFLFIILKSTLLLAIILLALTVVLITFSEKKGWMEQAIKVMGKNRTICVLIFVIFIILLPFLVQGNNYTLHIMIMAGIFSIVALGLNFQIGGIGQINFATAAFYGTGAYTTAILTTKLGVSPWLGTLLAMGFAAVLGLIVGYPALKARGYYLSLVTMALQLMFTLLIVNINWIGGPNGVPSIPSYTIFGYSLHSPLHIFGLQLPYQVNYLYLVYSILALVVIFSSRIARSRIGIAWNAIDQDPVVAACQGVSLTKTQMLAFCLGAVFAGLAGGLYAHYTSFIGSENFDFSVSLIFICMVVLGGTDNVPGVVVGAIFLTMLDEKLRDFANLRLLMYALILIVMLILRPKGLLPKRIRLYPKKGIAGLEKNANANTAVDRGGSH